MTPEFETDAELGEAFTELSRREPIFHRPEFGTTRADFEAMTDAEFWEVGASGQRYSRTFVLDTLERRHADPQDELWEVQEPACRRLAPGLFLFTYTLLQNGTRLTRRATIWRKTADGWKILYHQGTLLPGSFAEPA